MTHPRPKYIAFVCVENANRSQMAEAFARHFGGAQVLAYSAGTQPAACVNPKAVAAMRELGIDLSAHRPKPPEALPQVEFDVVVSMGCGDRCPSLRAKAFEDWPIPDPKKLPPEAFNAVRDEIARRVRDLIQRLCTEASG